MKAMVLRTNCEIELTGRPRQREDLPLRSAPLEPADLPVPEPGDGEVLIRVAACGICRTELDQIEGRIAPPRLPIVPGHQPVGTVEGLGRGVTRFRTGDRVGAAWIYSSCGRCAFCLAGDENLCEQFQATGCHADGGYAEYMTIPEAFAYAIPPVFDDAATAAPLMCSGVIGYRSLRLTGMEDGRVLGLYGFGAAHHLVIQMARYKFPHSRIFVVTRSPVERDLAMSLGADWAGEIDAETPQKMHCAIDSTPAWRPLVRALGNLERGGRLVVNLIRKEETDKDALLELDYPKHLWLEKEIKSVANVTRRDAEEFLALAAEMRIEPEVQRFRLEDANEALVQLKGGRIRGAKVLVMGT
jgi:propanol-preferring alcohol dehydrogenase